jgi:DNA-binding NarL/FixJ family response regulator
MTISQLQERRVNGNGHKRVILDKTASTGHRSDAHKISVMLVDDEATFLRIETLFLETRYRNDISVVGTANGGEECLAKAQLLAPELILIDLNMPGLSGLQTIPLLRIMFPETRIIALTLNDGESARRSVLAAGGNELVSKVRMSTDLMPAIRRVMEQDQLKLEYASA